ncbi:DUF417 family protein [Arthrobacter sp. Br18]|uniref:YkgB family protein n=1 Tax=Arthrobacter sp. Br18 TaxID=1312954 RepID=UPI001C1E4F28|nr:DUF417 family protein [Arthrobacter sp. Br18]
MMKNTSTTGIEQVGASVLRSSLATNLIWIGSLKFQDYEMENIRPLVTSSPLFSGVLKKLGEKKTAQLIGVAEIGMGVLIAAKPIAPRASALGSFGAIGTFVTTLSFMATTPGVRQESHGKTKLSMVGQFLLKDAVLLGASILTAAESLQQSRRR